MATREAAATVAAMTARELVAGSTPTRRIQSLKAKMLAQPRYLSVEQALIVTEVYRLDEGSIPVKRARSLAEAMRRMAITVDPEELIVSNRTEGVRAGVVFPEAGISWIDKEIEGLPTRPQDKFEVRPEDVTAFREQILPFWRGKTLEDSLRREAGPELDAIAKVVKINQKDHAQGHICPDTAKWIAIGPAGLRREAAARLARAAYVSPSYLFRVFRKMMGVSPMHYRNLVRVDKAKLLLLERALTVEDVASRVGFEDVKYFARVFKKETGTSPSEFRRSNARG